MNAETGKYIIFFGLMVVIIGVMIYFFHDKFNWIGRLPGDIRVEKKNFRLYFPITTLILFSLLISFFVWIIRKIF